ncbi:HAD hydrolase family protein [Paenibacillus amylolyticus]|nr:HAD hydrolase family protein [Paenibacillus amylolyticus]
MKLFATDLDGTLLNIDSQISPENAAAIQKAQQSGMKVTIATGRLFRCCDHQPRRRNQNPNYRL